MLLIKHGFHGYLLLTHPFDYLWRKSVEQNILVFFLLFQTLLVTRSGTIWQIRIPLEQVNTPSTQRLTVVSTSVSRWLNVLPLTSTIHLAVAPSSVGFITLQST